MIALIQRLACRIGLLMIALPSAPFAQSQIVAHRGASHDAPENTLAAFKLAWEQGADAIEGDFYLTKDRRIVCIHDGDTERVAGRKRVVAESTRAQLRKLDVGSWKGRRWAGERIPTIDEVLGTVPDGKKVFLELKSGKVIVPFLKQALDASGLKPEQIIILAFDEATVIEAKRILPSVRVCWLVGYSKDKATGAWTPPLSRVLGTLKRIGADGVDSDAREILDAAFVKDLRAANLAFHVWTVDDPSVAERFRRLGVDSITTNRPGWLREQLKLR